MKRLLIKMPVMMRATGSRDVVRPARISYAGTSIARTACIRTFMGTMLAGFMFAGGALVCGDAIAQQASTAQPPTQESGQIDLLATVQDNGTDQTAPTISSIDEAVKAISGEAENAAATGADTPVIMAISPAADTATESSAPSATLTSTAVSASPSANLQRADAPKFGVTDIGVDAASGEAERLTATIWRGTSVERAIMLLDTSIVVGSSPALSSLAGDVVARRAVRPDGASETDQTLMSKRLEWLAAAGRSQDLAVMVDQLPNEAPWLEWKQWLVETQLMSRRDDDACRNVMYQVGRTLEPFWHKAKVICTAVHKGDIAGAQFAADILFAMGVDDPVFSGLVGKLLNGTDPGPIDPALVEQLHIVLMEAAHHDIDIAGLETLPDSSIQTAVGLRYLDPDARLVATWRALHYGFIDHERAAKLWRSVTIETDPPQLALARHQSQPSALTRALVWRALDAEKSANRLPFIAAAMDVDIAAGAGLMMAPLYAELGREAMEFDGADAVLAGDDGALQTKLSMLIGVGDTDEMPAILAGGEARAARDLLDMAQAGRADMPSLAKLGKFSLLPLAPSGRGDTSAGSGEAMSWLVTASPDVIRTETFLSVSPIILQALDEAAAADRVAETILLAHRAVGDNSLAVMNPADAARIAAALTAVDQASAALQFRREVVAAHLLASAKAQVMNSLPVTAATTSQEVAPIGSTDIIARPESGPAAGPEAGSVVDPVVTIGGQDITTETSNEQGTLAPASITATTRQGNGEDNL